MKHLCSTFLFAITLVMTALTAQADWAAISAPINGTPAFGHYPYPYPGHPGYGHPGYPNYPVAPWNPGYYPFPQPMPYGTVTCFAQGLANGAYFYGIAYNVYTANQWAMYACNSTGQYCRLTGCRY